MWWVEWQDERGPQRALISKRSTLGRARQSDIVIGDPYVSRSHCVLEPRPEGLFVDARQSLNHVESGGKQVEAVLLGAGGRFMVGKTVLRVAGRESSDDESTLELDKHAPAVLVLRASTRELLDVEGTLMAQFAPMEFRAFLVLARAYPHAVPNNVLGNAIWGEGQFDVFQLHRLLQRVRARLDRAGGLVENVRGAGYRVQLRIDVLDRPS